MRYLFLAFFLCSCATMSFNAQTKYSKDETDQLFGYCLLSVLGLVEEVGSFSLPSYYGEWKFFYTEEWIKIPKTKMLFDVADGLTNYETKVVVVKVHDCLWDSALLHEMAHIIQIQATGFLDYHHTDEQWWSAVKEKEKEMLNFCPENYKRKPYTR